MSLLLQLPSECVLHILKLLPVADVVAVSSCCTTLHQLVADDCFWADLAEAKWGPAVRELKLLADADCSTDGKQQAPAQPAQPAQPAAAAAAAATALPPAAVQTATAASAPRLGSWQGYCYKRMSAKTIRPSPLHLLQESYPDPWQHIICCVLCSRTSGSSVIRAAVAAFFEALPTPTAVIQAQDALLLDLLHPLGLQATRLSAVRSVSHGFLATHWTDVREFRGCGKFVADSWRIFCQGYRDVKDVSDANLRQYVAWCNRQLVQPGVNEACKVNQGTSGKGSQRTQQHQKQTPNQQRQQDHHAGLGKAAQSSKRRRASNKHQVATAAYSTADRRLTRAASRAFQAKTRGATAAQVAEVAAATAPATAPATAVKMLRNKRASGAAAAAVGKMPQKHKSMWAAAEGQRKRFRV